MYVTNFICHLILFASGTVTLTRGTRAHCMSSAVFSCRRAGYPFGTLVDFASDGGGLPIFCLSPLAIHARNLIEDPRCSLVVQMPGWTGLANARVTIFGDVYQLPADMQVRCGG
jgi:putative heme iron utilization protein